MLAAVRSQPLHPQRGAQLKSLGVVLVVSQNAKALAHSGSSAYTTVFDASRHHALVELSDAT
jgi:hypothetical protein